MTTASQIRLSSWVHDMGMFTVSLENLGQIIRDYILMFHRMQRQVQPRHISHFPRPKPARINHVFCVN